MKRMRLSSAVSRMLAIAFVIIALCGTAVAADFCMMPPYPGSIAEQVGAAKVASHIATSNMLQSAGLNAPASFDMSRFIGYPHGAAKRSPNVIRPFNVLCVLVDFEDKPHVEEATYFDSLVFGHSAPSVRAYYRGQSRSTLDLVTHDAPSAIAWIRLPHTYAYYVNDNYGFGQFPRNAQGLVVDVVAALGAAGIDLSPYDNDGNGYVDGLLIAHAGTGAELSGKSYDIWSHKWGITPVLIGSVYVSDYAIMPEYWFWPANKMTVGVFCHETGHLFGLPDLYDTDGSSKGMGNGCVMASGSWLGGLGAHPCGFCAPMLMQLGFAEPVVLPLDGHITLAKGEFARIQVAQGDPGKYYTVQFRPKDGQDFYLNLGGLQICRVDESKLGNEQEWRPGIEPSRHRRVAWIQADNEWALDGGVAQWYGERQDWYPTTLNGGVTVTEFGPTTEPSSNWYDGSQTSVTMQILHGGSYIDESAEIIFRTATLEGDINGDGAENIDDLWYFVNAIFFGGPGDSGAMDFNHDGVMDAIDLNWLIQYLVTNGKLNVVQAVKVLQKVFGGN